MKHKNRNRILFLGPTVLLGLCSLFLHQYMMQNCFDHKGLLIAGNLPGRLLLGIGVGFALYLLCLLGTIGGNGDYAMAFPRCILSGLLCIAAGVELAMTLTQEFTPDAPWKLGLGLAAALSMIAVGLCRMLGKRPWFVFHGMVCSFYIYEIIINYQLWNSDPNVQDYAYQMLGCAMLMLAAFHRTCCDAGLINRKKLIFTGLAAAFCCLVCLSDPNMPIFYLASGMWAAGAICNVAQFPADAGEPEGEEAPEEVPAPAQEIPPEEAQTVDELLVELHSLLDTKEDPEE